MTLKYATREGARNGAALARQLERCPAPTSTSRSSRRSSASSTRPGSRVTTSERLADPIYRREIDREPDSRHRPDIWTYAPGPARSSWPASRPSTSLQQRLVGCVRPGQHLDQRLAPDSIGVRIVYTLSPGHAAGLGWASSVAAGPGSIMMSDRTSWPSTRPTSEGPDAPPRGSPTRPRSSRPRCGPDHRRSSPGRCSCSSSSPATVIDLSWYWTNNLRMQRAADAAALAGVVFLPGDPDRRSRRARRGDQERLHRRRSAGSPSPRSRTPANNRRLKVTIPGPINTFFARVLGMAIVPGQPRRQGRLRPARADGQPRELLRRGLLRGPCRDATPRPGNTDWNADRTRGPSAAANGPSPTGPD